jgi:hypothetical protein
MFVLEALRAKHGDALLLHYGTKKNPRLAVIDAGPGGVYADAVKPRLLEIREERGLAENESLEIDFMMVSHLDADHITGILDLMRRLRDLRQAKKPLPWKISRFWHNAFDDLTGGKNAGASTASLQTASLVADVLPPIEDDAGSSLMLASVGQGRELRDLVKFFGLDGNPPFGGIVKEPHKPIELEGLELTVLGPDDKNLEILQKDWDKKVQELLAKKSKSAKAELADYVDKSVYNLSSIVVLAKADKKTMLLTGDARGDYTLTALRKAGLLEDGKPLKVDLLKLPHHGSDRNVDQDYFDNIQAKHYVISADGKYTNPDVPTLEMISKSRKDNDFTIWLTNAPSDFADEAVGDEVAKFFAADLQKRKYNVEYRDSDALGVRVALA